MSKNSRFGVAFVGYTARVVNLKNAREIDYAMLDFVSGFVSLKATGAWLFAPSLSDLAPFVASLPGHARHLREKLSQSSSGITVEFEENSVHFEHDAILGRVIRQFSERCSETKHVLAQAHHVGIQIRRRPYAEYIDEIKSTGFARVVCHGFVIFENGKLFYHPDYREARVRKVDASTMSVEPCGAPTPNAVGNC